MTPVGLWMLLVLGVLVITSGLPVWALLLGTSSLFAVVGVALGQVDARLLTALTPRLIGLLEHDLLQALPLYVFVGMLLERLHLADAMLSLLQRLLRPLRGDAALAALGVGALVAPMNGSVASSASLLSRLVAPRLAGMAPARGVALLSAAATIGIVVPPSLVLLLLGDAMLRAHTEASNLPGFALAGLRIVNTQDVLRAALLPAAALLLSWMALAWWLGRTTARDTPRAPPVPLRLRDAMVGTLAIAAIVALLAGVFTGVLLAVEAAALAGCALVVYALASGAMVAAQWRAVLAHTLQLSGALMALLVGATTFSLVFRAWGSDRWLSELVLHSGLSPWATTLALLVFVAACAWVLDAFEMIFVIVPIVAPGLVLQLGDAQQVAVLLLLVLQLGFIVPPMGYALLVVQSRSGLPAPPLPQLARALAPYALAQCAVLACVLCWPAFVHQLDAPGATPALSEDEIVRQMEEMAQPPQPAASEPEDAAPAARQ